jgi:hypothetical protein
MAVAFCTVVTVATVGVIDIASRCVHRICPLSLSLQKCGVRFGMAGEAVAESTVIGVFNNDFSFATGDDAKKRYNHK